MDLSDTTRRERVESTRFRGGTTVYHLATLTKPFFSTVLLQLVEEGKVSPGSRFSYDGDS